MDILSPEQRTHIIQDLFPPFVGKSPVSWSPRFEFPPTTSPLECNKKKFLLCFFFFERAKTFIELFRPPYKISSSLNKLISSFSLFKEKEDIYAVWLQANVLFALRIHTFLYVYIPLRNAESKVLLSGFKQNEDPKQI